ncbi:hypothetical protein [Trebonia sp.]|uniref:hypothetical protein n=1 Tax=Trebonia sp. TaxID=2767075 RepID=UPI00261BADDA|nr:hypothetical protein [Trebonia sp.]
MGLRHRCSTSAAATAANEAVPLEPITAWGLQPAGVARPWNTAGRWCGVRVAGGPAAIGTVRGKRHER